MSDISSRSDNSLELKLKSDANEFEAEVSDISKQRLFSRLESELAHKLEGGSGQPNASESKPVGNSYSSRLLALAASVLVVLSLGVLVLNEPNTGDNFTPQISEKNRDTKSEFTDAVG
ncbi:MAG: hypothetical protein OQK04_13675, partial [Kangiellaceae bacterium]|nr:hypothetical protein [Kangiellaceae bacterium]